MTVAAQPSFEYLLSASTTSLESLQLSRLDQIAALKSQITDAVEAWATAELDVRLTRLILATRHALSEPQHRVLAHLHSLTPTVCSPAPRAADVLSIHPRPHGATNLPTCLLPFSPPAQSVRAHHRPSAPAPSPTDAPTPTNLRIAA